MEQKNIVAMQGPFGKELNMALYRHYGVTTVVTKESGHVGSVDEKVAAALELGLHVILISRPRIDYGQVFSRMDLLVAQVQKEEGGKQDE